MIGESIQKGISDAVRSTDGSWIAIETNKGSYSAGETIHGFVVAQLNSARSVDRVLVKVHAEEDVLFDIETSRTVTEGQGDNAKTKTVYEHHEHLAHETILNDIVVASGIQHKLAAGTYKYPFAYTLAPNLPGCVHFHRERDASDPHWRMMGRRIRTRGSVSYRLEALFDVQGTFSHDLTSKQHLTVNAMLEASRLAPQHAETVGKVNLCCCVNRGQVALAADFDKGAYAAGETARVHAIIKNDSKENVQRMEVKLVRSISLRSMNRTQDISDVVAKAKYPGVDKGTSATRDMALPFRDLLPTVNGRRVVVSYALVCECDVCCAPNISVRLTPAIYEPSPHVWGLAALGIAVPAGLDMSFAGIAPTLMPAQQQQHVVQAPAQMQIQQQATVNPSALAASQHVEAAPRTVVMAAEPTQPAQPAQSAQPAQKSEPASALPPGWREETTEDGEVYYENDKTGETTWERPAPVKKSAPPKKVPPKKGSDLPPGWKQHYDDDGDVFWEDPSGEYTREDPRKR